MKIKMTRFAFGAWCGDRPFLSSVGGEGLAADSRSASARWPKPHASDLRAARREIMTGPSWIPNRFQVKDKARQLGIGAQCLEIVEHGDHMIWSVNEDPLRIGMNQPTQETSIGEILFHLFLQLFQ